jgi:hypothetical protein
MLWQMLQKHNYKLIIELTFDGSNSNNSVSDDLGFSLITFFQTTFIMCLFYHSTQIVSTIVFRFEIRSWVHCELDIGKPLAGFINVNFMIHRSPKFSFTSFKMGPSTLQGPHQVKKIN